MGHKVVVSGYMISTSIPRLIGDQRDPGFWGITYGMNDLRQNFHFPVVRPEKIPIF